MKVGILNVTGYAGVELARILSRHPQVEIVAATGRSDAGKPLGQVFPHLESLGLNVVPEITESVDLVFSALPHQASAEACVPFLEQGVKVVDISADFRLKSATAYQEWYDIPHPYPQYLEEVVYGLTELHRPEIGGASLVANPGCYPTSALLALAPAVQAGIVEPSFIVDSKSGVSGAGRGLKLSTHFSEVNESVSAYSIEGHFHLPEMLQELRAMDSQARLTFVPHLVPMTRGILSTCYATVKEGALPAGAQGNQELATIYHDFYREHPFVRLAQAPPATKHTLGNNQCLVYPVLGSQARQLVVISCLDNLVKGAAGQAVQNMNVMCGLPEEQGLEALALYP